MLVLLSLNDKTVIEKLEGEEESLGTSILIIHSS